MGNQQAKYIVYVSCDCKDYSPEAMAHLQKPEIVAKRVESAKNSENNGMHGKKHKPTSLLQQKSKH